MSKHNPTHPGESIGDAMREAGMSATELAGRAEHGTRQPVPVAAGADRRIAPNRRGAGTARLEQRRILVPPASAVRLGPISARRGGLSIGPPTRTQTA